MIVTRTGGKTITGMVGMALASMGRVLVEDEARHIRWARSPSGKDRTIIKAARKANLARLIAKKRRQRR